MAKHFIYFISAFFPLSFGKFETLKKRAEKWSHTQFGMHTHGHSLGQVFHTYLYVYYFVFVFHSLIPFVQMIFINILRQVHCAQLTRMPISRSPLPTPLCHITICCVTD